MMDCLGIVLWALGAE